MNALGMVSGLTLGIFGFIVLWAWAAAFSFAHIRGFQGTPFNPKTDRWSVFLGVPVFALALISLGALWMIGR